MPQGELTGQTYTTGGFLGFIAGVGQLDPAIRKAPDAVKVETSKSTGSLRELLTGPVPGPGDFQLPPSFFAGVKDPAGRWEEIRPGESVRLGDQLRFTYRMNIPFLLEWQRDHYLAKLRKDDRFELQSFQFSEERRELQVHVKLTGIFHTNPVPLVAALVAGAILAVAVGIGIYLTLDKVEKLSTITVAGTRVNLAPFLMAGVVGIFILSTLRRTG